MVGGESRPSPPLKGARTYTLVQPGRDLPQRVVAKQIKRHQPAIRVPVPQGTDWAFAGEWILRDESSAHSVLNNTAFRFFYTPQRAAEPVGSAAL